MKGRERVPHRVCMHVHVGHTVLSTANTALLNAKCLDKCLGKRKPQPLTVASEDAGLPVWCQR